MARTSVMTGGSNNFATTSEDLNGIATDFMSDGVIGAVTSTSGVAPMTGAGAVNAQGSPNMSVAITGGTFYVTATPTSQNSQRFRVKMDTNSSYTINSNSTGGTRYDWIYVQLDATLLANPAAAGDTTGTYVTSRSTSSTTDNGTPPTYGTLLAVVTVSNGAVSIVNGNIADGRTRAGVSATANAASTAKSMYDYVESGCVWTADAAGSTRVASMTSGVVWIGGSRLTVAAVTSRTMAASKDVYVMLSDAGNGTATITYDETVSNNAASPALSAGYLRLAIIVVGASSIATAASINQGQEDRVLPIASSVPYAVTDSLGNLICNRSPYPSIIGYRQITTNATGTTIAQATGLSCPVIVPTGRKVKVSSFGTRFANSTTNATVSVSLWDGVVNSGTKINQYDHSSGTVASDGYGYYVEATVTPTSTSKTYNVGGVSTIGTWTITAASTTPAWIKVELV